MLWCICDQAQEGDSTTKRVESKCYQNDDLLVTKDKAGISQILKNLDEGNLTFPRMELLPFSKEDRQQCQQICD